MLDRMHGSKITSDELKSFYTGAQFPNSAASILERIANWFCVTVRAAIEDEYARKLQALCRKSLGSCETGSLRASLDVVRGETEAIAKAHSAIAGQMKSELDEPLSAFASGLKERRKIIQNTIERLHKLKMQQTQVVNKVSCMHYACRSLYADYGRLGIVMNRTVFASRVTWRKGTWSWARKSARTRPSSRRLRFNWLLIAMSMKLL